MSESYFHFNFTETSVPNIITQINNKYNIVSERQYWSKQTLDVETNSVTLYVKRIKVENDRIISG